MNNTNQHQCQQVIYGEGYSATSVHLCHNNAITQHKGKWLCRIHSPEYLARKEAKRVAEAVRKQGEWQATSDRISIRQDITKGFETAQLHQHLAEIRQAIANILSRG